MPQSTRTVDKPSCGWCGAPLYGTRIYVDQPNAFTCPDCEDQAREETPESYALYTMEVRDT